MSSAAPVKAIKKTILFLGRPDANMEEIHKSLVSSVSDKVTPCFIFAKDGPEAASKAGNQKLDCVVVDAKTPRLREGGFIDGIRRNKNTADSGLIVIIPSDESSLQERWASADQIIEKPCDVETLVRALAKALVDVQRDEIPAATPSSSFAVDARVLNALVKSTCFICQQYGIDGIQLKKPQLKSIETSWGGDIAASIPIQSKVFQGAFLISFDQAVYLKLLTNMLGEEQSSINDENADAIGEMSNMILGNAKSDFTQYQIGMTIPQMLKKGQSPATPAGSAALVITAETPNGKIYMEVIAHRLTSGS